MKWNPYYVLYAKHKGNEPAKQLKVDEVAYPGGVMCGFILWIRECKVNFWKLHPDAMLDAHTIYDHAKWHDHLKACAS